MIHRLLGRLGLAAAIGLCVSSLQAGTLRLDEMLASRPVTLPLPTAEADEVALPALGATSTDDMLLASFDATALLPAGINDQRPIAATSSVATTEVNFSPFGMMVASATPTVIPEPSTFVLLAMGAVGIYVVARRRRRPGRA
jgi:hypothetical protein